MRGDPDTSTGSNRARDATQLVADLIQRRLDGEQVTDQAVLDAHPELMPELGEKLRDLRRVEEAEQAATTCDQAAGLGGSKETPGKLPSHSLPGYELLAEVHRGGQGVVYRAIQTATGREVAVKVLREGPFVGPQGRTRFQREVRVLAQLKHSNIVTIHDSGVASDHLYFVMDWISGDSLDSYTAGRSHGVEELLRLFGKICQAVHAAHLRGVIHRDLKPSNIMIDERGEPHILDFGLAKFSSEEIEPGHHWPSMTATGQFVGSLPWAAPEQAEGSSQIIDLRTDVYALGLTLYYMVSGRFPYEVTGPMRQVFDNILHTSPTPLRSLRKELPEDVETIALKCLAKEPDRRYQSAAALAEDVERFLASEPILARAPSTMYQVKKLLRRHTLPVVLIVALFASLILFASGMSWLYAQAVAQRDRASQAEQQASAINEFLVDDLLAAARPENTQGADISIQDVLENAAARIEGAFPDQPLVKAGIRSAIGQSYVSLGLFGAAEPHLREAANILRRGLGNEHEETLRAQTRVIDLLYRKGQFSEAIPVAQETRLLACSVLGDEHPVSLQASYEWARMLWAQGKLAESRNLHGQILEQRRRILGESHPDTLASLTHWGLEGLLDRFDLVGAEERFREAYETGRSMLGEDHPDVLRAAVNLGYALMEARKLDAAEVLLERTLPAHRRVLGENHPDTLICTLRMALLRKEQDRIDEAEDLSCRARDISRRLLGDEHPVTMSAMQYYGSILLRHGKSIEAVEVFRDAINVEDRHQVLGQELRAQALDCLSLALARLGRYEEAAGGHRDALLHHRSYMDDNPLILVWPLRCLIGVLAVQEKEDEARPLARELLERRRASAEAPDTDAYQLNCYARELLTIYPHNLRDPVRALEVALMAYDGSTDAYHYNRYTLALAYEANSQLDRAIEFARRALTHIPVEFSMERADYEAALVRMLKNSGDDRAAEDVYRKTLELRRAQFPVGHPDTAESLTRLGETLIRHGEFEEAETYLREAVEIRESALNEGDWQIGEAVSLLGASLTGQARHNDAEPLLTDGFTILVESPMAYSDQTKQALKRIEDFLQNTGRTNQLADFNAMLPRASSEAPSTEP